MERNASENRWLPPSPHKEAILKKIAGGQAHIEERGHNIPSLLVFEDGGVIELHRVRYEMTRRGMQLVATDETSSGGQTKHNDVCGSVDELKGVIREESELSEAHLEHLNRLLDDVCYMVSRMHRRRESYQEFAAAITALAKSMKEIAEPETEHVPAKADEIRALLRNLSETATSERDQIDASAEAIRDVANGLESSLTAYRKAAVQIGALFEEIRGGRNWE